MPMRGAVPTRPSAILPAGCNRRSVLGAVIAAPLAALTAPLLLSARPGLAQALPDAPGSATGRLPAGVEEALAQAGLPADALSVVLQELGRRVPPRLSWQPARPMNPASLMKLLPTAAALELLGPAWTWTTPVWLLGPVREGRLDGSLVIKGSGDPKLVIERLWLMLRRVQQLGVREIGGDIVLDRSAFAVPDAAPGDFDGEPFRPYNAGADALLLNYRSVLVTLRPDPASGSAALSVEPALAGVRIEPPRVPLSAGACGDWRGALKPEFADPNRIAFGGTFAASCGERVWPLAYADPRSYNARLLAALWSAMGGQLGGTVRDGSAPTDLRPSFEVQSPPLAELIRDVNKFSNNVMAQQLFLTLALHERGRGTVADARAVLQQWLATRFGADAQGTVIDNGSGLSRESRLSARLLVRLLEHVWASPAMPELAASLPITGLDGTARNLRAEAGRAHLKTGSLRDAAGVAGFVHGPAGRRFALAAMVNHPNAGAARPVFDALMRLATGEAGS